MGNFNHRRLKEYEEAILRHISQADVVMPGMYRGTIPVKHYLQKNTGLWVCEDLAGNYITGWTLPAHKVERLLKTGDVR